MVRDFRGGGMSVLPYRRSPQPLLGEGKRFNWIEAESFRRGVESEIDTHRGEGQGGRDADKRTVEDLDVDKGILQVNCRFRIAD